MILIKDIILPHSYLVFPTPPTEQHLTATLYIRFSSRVKSVAVIELVCSPVCYLVELVVRFEYVIVAIELTSTWNLFPLH